MTKIFKKSFLTKFKEVKPTVINAENFIIENCIVLDSFVSNQPIKKITLRNCHFEKVNFFFSRLVYEIEIINCTGEISFKCENTDVFNLSMLEKCENLKLSIKNYKVSQEIENILNDIEYVSFINCRFDSVVLNNFKIKNINLIKCIGDLTIKATDLTNIKLLNIKSHNLWLPYGHKFNFKIENYEIERVNLITQSYIKDTEQNFEFTKNKINNFELLDNSIYLPSLMGYMTLPFYLFCIVLAGVILSSPANVAYSIAVMISFFAFLMMFMIGTYTSNNKTIVNRIGVALTSFLFSVGVGFYSIITYNILNKKLLIKSSLFNFDIIERYLAKLNFLDSFPLINKLLISIILNDSISSIIFYGIMKIFFIIFILLFSMYYNIQLSSSKISLKLIQNDINLINFQKMILKDSNNIIFKVVNIIKDLIYTVCNYILSFKTIKINFEDNKIKLYKSNSDAISNEEEIIYLLNNQDIKFEGKNFELLKSKTNIFIFEQINKNRKNFKYFVSKQPHESHNDIEVVSNFFKGLYYFLTLTVTSLFLRLKNLILSFIFVLLLGGNFFFVKDNITIKDNIVQLEIIKTNNICKENCNIYFNDLEDKNSKINVPNFYDKYNSYYYTMNKLISIPLLEHDKSFKANNEFTEFMELIYKIIGIIYTSAIVFYIGKLILIKKSEIEIEKEE